ncbi:MAG TPA: V-type ATP synthase subunit F [Spirochaetota bacterium]|nr:V-type ATP synthase subunit F [Spirochaetota bacterium]HPJ36707.1 V-type ATP synthase subunit F [Spirochaetota bacterium]
MNSGSPVKGRIGAVGPPELMLLFRGAGVMVRDASTADEGVKGVTDLAGNGCGIIFVSDDLLAGMREIISHYSAEPWPVITGFPDIKGKTLNSGSMIKDLVKKAVGIDIAGLTDI